MLSYRHTFHAGNSADVLKHTVLISCLKYLTQKEKPLLCVDTHAGAGAYRSADCNELQRGAGKLMDYPENTMPAPVQDYLKIINADKNIYPGSPVIFAKFLRVQDRLVCFELHPKDFDDLKNTMKNHKTETRNTDGFAGLKSLIPSRSGRGLFLIDPSWEEKDEYKNIPGHIIEFLKRFHQGTYIIWYPLLLKTKTPERIGETLYNLYDGNRCCAEIFNLKTEINEHSPRGMYGSGLAVYNPPWTLNSELNDTLPFLAKTLMDNGDWNLKWGIKQNDTQP